MQRRFLEKVGFAQTVFEFYADAVMQKVSSWCLCDTICRKNALKFLA